MAAPQPVSLGYIADAALQISSASGMLEDIQDSDISQDARDTIEVVLLALNDIVLWAQQVNRALSTVDSIAVDDHPID
jgi:hypothetical protein